MDATDSPFQLDHLVSFDALNGLATVSQTAAAVFNWNLNDDFNYPSVDLGIAEAPAGNNSIRHIASIEEFPRNIGRHMDSIAESRSTIGLLGNFGVDSGVIPVFTLNEAIVRIEGTEIQ